MIPPVLVSVPVLTPMSAPIPVSIPVSVPEVPMLRSMSVESGLGLVEVEVPQVDEASPSRPTLLQETVTGTVADTSSTLTAAWLPARVPLVQRLPINAGFVAGCCAPTMPAKAAATPFAPSCRKS